MHGVKTAYLEPHTVCRSNIIIMKYTRRICNCIHFPSDCSLLIADCGRRIADLLSNKIRNPKSELRNQNIINEVYQADKVYSLVFSRKEVFQPHLPVRLPCYDLAPVTSFTLGRSLRLRTSGTPSFHGLTGGVYKARERIHRAMADARLLANPASRSRVADSDPN